MFERRCWGLGAILSGDSPPLRRKSTLPSFASHPPRDGRAHLPAPPLSRFTTVSQLLDHTSSVQVGKGSNRKASIHSANCWALLARRNTSVRA